MDKFITPIQNNQTVIALGAESAGNFSVYMPSQYLSPLSKGGATGGLMDATVYFSEDFGDLAEDANFEEYTRQLSEFIRKNKIRPTIILSDLHPLFRTTELAQDLAKKYKAKYIPVQHHLAHIFSSIGDKILQTKNYKLPTEFLGIACDGTGFGLDEKIWGGEAFAITKKQITKNKQISKSKLQITRIGHLENQILLGGEMAIKEPARLLISILAKIFPPPRVIPGLTRNLDSRLRGNDNIYNYVKSFYTRNEFELLWNQLEQNFNCMETSSTARILDAVSVLLGFSKNERLSKHGPVALLEQNSTKPYALKPKLENYKLKIPNSKQNSNSNPPAGGQISSEMLVLNTTFLFEYLIKNLHKDKSRLAATAQKYIADGLVEITNNLKTKNQKPKTVFFAGGMANNKIISSILESQGIYTNKKIPRGDAGLSFGQIFYFLLADPRD